MSNKNYHDLIQDRIFIGGTDDVKDVLKNEKADVIFDLRAEVPETIMTGYTAPFDDAEHQEESIKRPLTLL